MERVRGVMFFRLSRCAAAAAAVAAAEDDVEVADELPADTAVASDN